MKSHELAFTQQWGEEFENPADYPIWNYLLAKHEERFDGDYMDSLFIELRNKFETLGIVIDAKTSGIKHDTIKDEFVIPPNCYEIQDKLKAKLLVKSSELLHFQIKNFKLAKLREMIEKEIQQFADMLVDNLDQLFEETVSEDKLTNFILQVLNNFLFLTKKETTIAEANQYEFFQQLIKCVIESYKKYKLNNEIEIFFDRNPIKIILLDGLDEADNQKAHERYVCNFVFLIQQYFLKRLDKIKSIEFDIVTKREEVLRFVRQMLNLLDKEELMQECEQAILFVMSDEVRTVIPAISPVIPAHAGIRKDPCMRRDDEARRGDGVRRDNNILKTALYITCGVLLGVSIIAAFVFSPAFPLLMGFLAIHLIHVAPVIVKLVLVVAGVVAGGGVGFGSKKIAGVTQPKGKEEVVDEKPLPVVYKAVEKKEGKKVRFKDQPTLLNNGVFAKPAITPDETKVKSSEPHVLLKS